VLCDHLMRAISRIEEGVKTPRNSTRCPCWHAAHQHPQCRDDGWVRSECVGSKIGSSMEKVGPTEIASALLQFVAIVEMSEIRDRCWCVRSARRGAAAVSSQLSAAGRGVVLRLNIISPRI